MNKRRGQARVYIIYFSMDIERKARACLVLLFYRGKEFLFIVLMSSIRSFSRITGKRENARCWLAKLNIGACRLLAIKQNTLQLLNENGGKASCWLVERVTKTINLFGKQLANIYTIRERKKRFYCSQLSFLFMIWVKKAKIISQKNIIWQ